MIETDERFYIRKTEESEAAKMTIKEMQERKKELGFTYAQIAELSGVPVGTVQKVLGGITLTPRYETIMALEQVLGESEGLLLRESANAYMTKKQGEYTLDDYYHVIPDDMRVLHTQQAAPACPHEGGRLPAYDLAS